MDLIQTLEKEEIARLGKNIPEFAPGDTVVVNVNVVEGTRKRAQADEGVVIARRNRGLNSNFIVRKISSGEGVERTFQLYSPLIASIEVKRRGDVRTVDAKALRQPLDLRQPASDAPGEAQPRGRYGKQSGRSLQVPTDGARKFRDRRRFPVGYVKRLSSSPSIDRATHKRIGQVLDEHKAASRVDEP